MKTIAKYTAAALTAAGSLALASAASASIVCNNDGVCWHTSTDYSYQPEFNLTIHPNDWKWKEGDKFSFREHAGRGYWQGDSWKEF